MYIGQAPGLGQRSVFRFVSTANQSIISGRDLDGLVQTYTPGGGFLSLYIDGVRIAPADYTATDGSQIVLKNGKLLPADLDILVVADSPFSPANTYSKTETDTRNTFSTSEVDTGKKWIDGKAIYRKIVNCGALAATAATKTTAHGLPSGAAIVGITGVLQYQSDTRIATTLPHTDTNALTGGIGLFTDATNISIRHGSDRSGTIAYVTLEYTKA